MALPKRWSHPPSAHLPAHSWPSTPCHLYVASNATHIYEINICLQETSWVKISPRKCIYFYSVSVFHPGSTQSAQVRWLGQKVGTEGLRGKCDCEFISAGNIGNQRWLQKLLQKAFLHGKSGLTLEQAAQQCCRAAIPEGIQEMCGCGLVVEFVLLCDGSTWWSFGFFPT